jgi:hypothetical protein
VVQKRRSDGGGKEEAKAVNMELRRRRKGWG